MKIFRKNKVESHEKNGQNQKEVWYREMGNGNNWHTKVDKKKEKKKEKKRQQQNELNKTNTKIIRTIPILRQFQLSENADLIKQNEMKVKLAKNKTLKEANIWNKTQK